MPDRPGRSELHAVALSSNCRMSAIGTKRTSPPHATTPFGCANFSQQDALC